LGKGGAYGVDLFFVLSAYLITELLFREKEQRGTLDVKGFYVRRLLRIWPLYYVFVPLAFAIPFFNPGREFSVRYLLPFLMLAGNWSLTLQGWHAGPVVIPLWSISVEEQFYLLWPPIVARLTIR
jgi:peptidoglycan/LPS O-acetylase OafA/YrhL